MRASLAKEVARHGGYQTSLINQVSSEELNCKAIRPQYSALKSEKGIMLPSLDNALDRFFMNKN